MTTMHGVLVQYQYHAWGLLSIANLIIYIREKRGILIPKGGVVHGKDSRAGGKDNTGRK